MDLSRALALRSGSPPRSGPLAYAPAPLMPRADLTALIPRNTTNAWWARPSFDLARLPGSWKATVASRCCDEGQAGVASESGPRSPSSCEMTIQSRSPFGQASVVGPVIPLGFAFDRPIFVDWSGGVDRLADVVFVTEVLVRHPFLSPRGYRNLATLREIALILAAARAPGGGAKRMPLADQARLLELRELTPVRGASVERLPTAPTAELASDTHWGWHLSGFVAAEGHVSLRDAASKFAPQFHGRSTGRQHPAARGVSGPPRDWQDPRPGRSAGASIRWPSGR